MDEGTYDAGTAQVNWASAADFWAMGGYGFYVWGSYVTVVIVLGSELALLKARRKRALTEVKQEINRTNDPR